jgi:L-fuculose-phosphate aldolase
VADKTVGGNVSALGYSVFKPGTSTADLSHAVEELAYIVSGRGVIRLETGDVPVAAGQALYVPAKVWHTVMNPGAEDLVMVFSFPSPDYPPTERREPASSARREPGELPRGTTAGHGGGGGPAGGSGLPDHRPVRPGGPHPGPRQRPRPDGRTIYIKRKGKALRDVLDEDVIAIPLDDPEGYLTPGAHLETIMHLETYLARPDVGAVIHTHPVYSIALGATAGGLELLSHDGLLFPDGVPVFDGTAGLVTTPQDGKGVARALGGSRAVLLRNHGILAAGEDISWAVLAALTLERAARIQFIARTLGETVPIPREVARELSASKYQEEFAEEYWQDWRRMLDNSS